MVKVANDRVRSNAPNTPKVFLTDLTLAFAAWIRNKSSANRLKNEMIIVISFRKALFDQSGKSLFLIKMNNSIFISNAQKKSMKEKLYRLILFNGNGRDIVS